MGEHILKISLVELTTVRIQCGKCGVVLEVPLDALDRVAVECSSCGQRFIRSGEPQHMNARLYHLKQTIGEVLSMKDAYAVEFLLKFPAGHD